MGVVKIKVERQIAPEGQDLVINCLRCGHEITRGRYCIVSADGGFIVGNKFLKACPKCNNRQSIPMLYNGDYDSKSAVMRFNIQGVPKEILFFVDKQQKKEGSVS